MTGSERGKGREGGKSVNQEIFTAWQDGRRKRCRAEYFANSLRTGILGTITKDFAVQRIVLHGWRHAEDKLDAVDEVEAKSRNQVPPSKIEDAVRMCCQEILLRFVVRLRLRPNEPRL